MDNMEKKEENVIEDLSIPENETHSDSEGDDINEMWTCLEEKLAESDRLDRLEYELDKEEKKILHMIMRTLLNHEIQYKYDSTRPKIIEIECETANRPLSVRIIIKHEVVILRAIFPFRVQSNSLALVALYISQFKPDNDFSFTKFNLNAGKVSMEYSYMVGKPDEYNAEYFWIYLTSIISSSYEIYEKLYRLSVGKVSGVNKNYYAALLIQSITLINGEEDEDDIWYGSESLTDLIIKELGPTVGDTIAFGRPCFKSADDERILRRLKEELDEMEKD